MTTTLKPDPKRVTDLIRHLPDLLSGTEPILERDQAREWIRQDPAMRLALVASGEVTRLLQSHSRMAGHFIRSVDPKLLSPIEFAKRHFNTRLMEALFEVGLYELSLHAEETGEYFSTVLELPFKPAFLQSVKDEWVTCCQSLGVVPDQVFSWPLPSKGHNPSLSHRHTAEIAFNACDKLRPGANGIEFYTTLLNCERAPAIGERAWRQYRDTHRDRYSILLGSLELALSMGINGQTADALRLEIDLAKQHPHTSALCFNGLEHALTLGASSSATRFAHQISDSTLSPAQVSAFARSLSSHASGWALERVPGAFDVITRVLRILPSPISVALERAVA